MYPRTSVPIRPPTCSTKDCNDSRVERFSLGTFELNRAAKGRAFHTHQEEEEQV